MGKVQVKTILWVFNILNIFQEKIFTIFERFDMVRAHIDNVLVITKKEPVDHLKAPEFFTETHGSRIKGEHIKVILRTYIN